ncbi:MAG TPA: scaffolding protein [Leuconostoc pseudomesenteroides]|nr:scaffolding protein [Leuconostoc pseudomesenteroides]
MADEVETTNANQVVEDNQNDDKLTFTPKEFDSEVDTRIANALATAKEKWDEEKQAEINQAEELAKLSAADRKKAEDEARQKALDERESALNRRELTVNVSSLLKERELPTDLAESLVKLGNADEISTVVDSLQQAIQQGINDGVKDRLRQDPPKNDATKINGDIGKVEFNAMTAAERVAFSKSNPEQFKQITGE